jgi:hypothetical protein
LKRFMEAFLESMQHIRRNKEDAVRTLAKILSTSDKQILDHAYEDIVSTMEPTLVPSHEAINNLLKMVAYTDKRAASIPPEKLFDFSLLEELGVSPGRANLK